MLGNWLAAEELAQAGALRTLRKPRVPDKLVEPISDDAMRRLLAVADVRDRAILLLLLDCGLRVSEAAGLRLGDLRPSVWQCRRRFCLTSWRRPPDPRLRVGDCTNRA